MPKYDWPSLTVAPHLPKHRKGATAEPAVMLLLCLGTLHPLAAQASHPLLEADLEEECGENPCDEMTPAEIYRNLDIFESSVDIGQGEVHTSGARWASREDIPNHTPSQEPAAPSPDIDDDVTAWMEDEVHPNDVVEVWATFNRLAWDSYVSTEYQECLAIIDGTATSDEDLDDVRDATIAARQAAGEVGLEDALDWLDSHDGEVVEYGPDAGTIRVQIPKFRLEALSELTDIQALEAYEVEADDAGYAYFVDGSEVDGYELMDLLQSEQFYVDGSYTGTGQTVALIESNGNDVRRNHPGFDDASGSDRFRNCDGGSTCPDNPNPNPGAAHSTATASVLLGDIGCGSLRVT